MFREYRRMLFIQELEKNCEVSAYLASEWEENAYERTLLHLEAKYREREFFFKHLATAASKKGSYCGFEQTRTLISKFEEIENEALACVCADIKKLKPPQWRNWR